MCKLRTLLRDSGKIPKGRPAMPYSGHMTCPFCDGRVDYVQTPMGSVSMWGCECFTEGTYEEHASKLYRDSLEFTAECIGGHLSEYADKIIERINLKGGCCPCRPLQDVPCPCEFMEAEVEKDGHCHCNLFLKGPKE